MTQRTSDNAPESSTTINDLELASCLAIFLWSSIPDDELLKAAEAGKLREPTVLSPKSNGCWPTSSRRFSQHFVQQWLGLDGLESVAHITDIALKEAMGRSRSPSLMKC
ncbi:MAG: DUF1592 domain-containing protein [Pirellulaceae bacterium]